MNRFKLALILSSVALSSCGGDVVKTISANDNLDDRTDGAMLSYYLPRATWGVTASFTGSSGLLSLKGDAAVAVMPDTKAPKMYLSYAHAGLSDDSIDVKLDNSMLSSIGSTASDQTIKVVEAANALLTQVGTTKTALATIKLTADTPAQPAPSLLKDGYKCGSDLTSTRMIDLTYEKQSNPRDLQWGDHCALSLDIKVIRSPADTRTAFAASQHLDNQNDICASAICRRKLARSTR